MGFTSFERPRYTSSKSFAQSTYLVSKSYPVTLNEQLTSWYSFSALYKSMIGSLSLTKSSNLFWKVSTESSVLPDALGRLFTLSEVSARLSILAHKVSSGP